MTEPFDDSGGRASAPAHVGRDEGLDCLKGIAIVTVVLGHTVQNVTSDFANYLPFRIIYAFHMPMFMFVAGMAMSFDVLPAPGKKMWRYVVDTIVKRAGRLLIPFVIWGLIVFVRSRPADSLVAWFSLLFREPDNGLWFLLALFEISVVVVLCVWAARLILDRRGAANDATEALIVLAACLAVGSTLFWLLRYVFPALGLAMYYVKYVCLGIVYRRLCPSGIHPAVGVAAFAVFAALVPFWVWNAPPAIDWHPRFLDDRIVTALFDFVIAMSGTLVTIEVAQLISRHTPAIAVNVMTYCGRRTLDIYALHYFLLSYFPPVIGPIALSLLASFLLRQIPLAALILFGDAKDRPVWWPAVRGLTERGAGAPS